MQRATPEVLRPLGVLSCRLFAQPPIPAPITVTRGRFRARAQSQSFSTARSALRAIQKLTAASGNSASPASAAVTVSSPPARAVSAYGAYYVLIPTQGSGSKVFLTVPVSVPSQSQVPAGWALYKDVFTADATGTLVFDTNTTGSPVMLLSEGISTWLGSPDGWMEGQLATVTPNADGTYTVTNIGNPMMGIAPPSNDTVTVDQIPAASAAIW